MISITFLGTAHGAVSPDRFSSSILVRSDASHILLDAGEPCSQRIRALGIDFESIDAILLTHAHPDHIGGLPLFLQANKIAKRTKSLAIALPAHVLSPLRSWLRTVLIPEERLGFPISFITWENGRTESLPDVSVTPHPSSHLDKLIEELDPAISAHMLELCWEGLRVVYSGDLGAAEDLVPILQNPPDVLICELAHFQPEDLVRVLHGKKIESLCLTHLGQRAAEKLSELQVYFDENLPDIGNIFFPSDGETIDFAPSRAIL